MLRIFSYKLVSPLIKSFLIKLFQLDIKYYCKHDDFCSSYFDFWSTGFFVCLFEGASNSFKNQDNVFHAYLLSDYLVTEGVVFLFIGIMKRTFIWSMEAPEIFLCWMKIKLLLQMSDFIKLLGITEFRRIMDLDLFWHACLPWI